MRILYQCNNFLPSVIGGVEVLSYHLVRALNRRAHDVLVLTECREEDCLGPQRFDDINLVRLKFDVAMGSRNFAAMRGMNAAIGDIVTNFRPDVLHLNDTGFGSLFFLRGGATGHAPRVLTLHSPIRPRDDLAMQGRLAMDADRIVGVSQANDTAAAAAMPDLQSKMSLIRNALPMPEPAPTDLPFSPPMLLCIGRLVHEKGFDVAIRAVALLKDRGLAVRLTIAGNGHKKDSLEMMAREIGVANYVTFLDWVTPDKVPDLLNSATLVVMPSRWPEPFGLVALQAAQMGRPVIASAIGGLPEIVDHGTTGLLVERCNEIALADAIGLLLSNEETARKFGAAARKRAIKVFDFDALASAYEQVYTEVVSAYASPGDSQEQVA